MFGLKFLLKWRGLFETMFVGLAFILTGCVPWVGVMPGRASAVGTVSCGLLANAEPLSPSGESFRFYRLGNRRYGVSELTGMIERTASKVAQAYPGSVLLVGEMSAQHGGFIGGHRSHRSGRDVDLAFYTADIRGRPAIGVPLIRFDRFGVGTRDGIAYRFDTERNWHLVEALLEDDAAEVQWILISDGLKAALLEWALENGREMRIVKRAASVLHQPSDSLPHDDHFHVRIYCPNGESGAYCMDFGPVWPWVSRPKREILGFTREELARLALED